MGPQAAPNPRLLPACALALLLAGCGGAKEGAAAAAESPWLTPGNGQENAKSGTRAERFFPLLDGMVYTYATINEVGEPGLLVARVHRTDQFHGELRYPSGAKSFSLMPDGVMVNSHGTDSYVLKLPLLATTTWRGEHGGQSKILDTNVSVDTPAGHYDGCVRTLEERMGDRPTRYSTTFCPEVGVVQIEVATGVNYERATLKSYAPPMRMREDGTDRIRTTAPDAPSP